MSTENQKPVAPGTVKVEPASARVSGARGSPASVPGFFLDLGSAAGFVKSS
jgi:hypothetical protein